MMINAVKFETAAMKLLEQLGLPRGAVTLRQTRNRVGQCKIVADLEAGARPDKTPDTIDGYQVEYQQRLVLKIR